MPAPVVKTPRDEKLWGEARRRVREEYGLTEQDGDRYWRLVMGIFRRMKGLRKKLLLAFRKARRLSPKYRVGEVVRVAVDGFDFAPRARITRVYWKPHCWWYDCVVLSQPEVSKPFEHSVPESEIAPVEDIEQGRGVRKRLLVVVRKAGDHWRDQPRAPKGGSGKYKGGQWMPRPGPAAAGQLDLRPIPDLGTALREFERMYVNRRPLLRALDPETGERTIRVIFDRASAWHAVTKKPPDFDEKVAALERKLGRRLSKRERERLRVFAPERAARLHWIELVLADPDQVWEATSRKGRRGYLFVARRDPEHRPYVVFLQRDKKDRRLAVFVTAYSVEGEGSPEEILRLARLLYERKKPGPPASKRLGGPANLFRVIRRLPSPGRLQGLALPASPGWAGCSIPV